MPRSTVGRGLWGVLATPFSGASLDVDHQSLRRLVGLHRSAGSFGLVVHGVFGESARLTAEERAAVVRTVRKEAVDLPLVIIAERDTADVISSATELLHAAEDDSAALMVQVSTSNAVHQADRLQTIQNATGHPVVLQDYPVGSGVHIAIGDLVEVVNEIPGIVAVKCEAPPITTAVAELTGRTGTAVFGALGGVRLLDELTAGPGGAMTGKRGRPPNPMRGGRSGAEASDMAAPAARSET